MASAPPVMESLMSQYKLDLVPHSYQGEVITQRQRDGYINATAMCKAANKRWSHYRENVATKAFIDALESEAGIPASKLIQSLSGGHPQLQGTWVHPQVAIHLAQWLSPKFAVQVSRWVYDWMSGVGSPVATQRHTPIFVRRFNTNWNRTDPGYFSIISELFIRVYGKLEQAGYILPDKTAEGVELRPDVSVGKTFPQWLKKYHPGLADKFKSYPHLLPNNMEVAARQYRNSVLPAFIEFIETHWLPKRAKNYFEKRDPKALVYLAKVLLPPPEDDDD